MLLRLLSIAKGPHWPSTFRVDGQKFCFVKRKWTANFCYKGQILKQAMCWFYLEQTHFHETFQMSCLTEMSLRPWVKNGRREKSRTGQQRRPRLKRVMQAALCGVMMFLLDGVRSGVRCNQLIFFRFSSPVQHENILISLFSNCNVLCVVIFVAFWGTFLCSCYISLLVSVTAFATHQPF